jgi:hypothetical protein
MSLIHWESAFFLIKKITDEKELVCSLYKITL